MMNKLLIFIPIAIFTCGQQSHKQEMPIFESNVYNETREDIDSLERQLDGLSSSQDEEHFLSELEQLNNNNDSTRMTDSRKEASINLEKSINTLKQNAIAANSQTTQSRSIPVEVNDDCLREKTTTYPVYLERGDVLYYKIGLQKPGTVKLYNADARALLKTYSKKTKVTDSLVVANKGIYLIEVVPGGAQYASLDITYHKANNSHPIMTVKGEEIECNAGSFRAVSNKGIALKTAFDQPRKFTLASQFKSAFTTAAKSIALVAVQIPTGATEVLYNLRISTSEQDKSSDGKFSDNMNYSYKRIRFLGLPLYESNLGSGLFNMLLDDNRPRREEDAYCNMYVFRSQSAAKQFQDGTKPASQLQYDVDYSTLGTQSCNGRIPAKGAKTIYLAFENERVRYTNYIWVEVLTATPITEYHTTKYTVE